MTGNERTARFTLAMVAFMKQAKICRVMRKHDPMGFACLLDYLKINPWSSGSIENARKELGSIEVNARGEIENSQSDLVVKVIRDWSPELKNELGQVQRRLSDAIAEKWEGKPKWMC